MLFSKGCCANKAVMFGLKPKCCVIQALRLCYLNYDVVILGQESWLIKLDFHQIGPWAALI